MSIASAELVPGDVIELEAGDHIPADSRVVWHTPNLAVQEASLTGESTPVAKTSGALDEHRDVPLAERANIVYLGTSVVSGKARAIVVETGMQTELGRIAGMIQSIGRETTPLQTASREIRQVSSSYLCFALVLIVFGLGAPPGRQTFIEMFLTAVSLAVAAIPEGLPAVVTIALALGVQRMVKRNALIRKLPAVETLGCATVICSDKTGTLTRNEMTVQAVYVKSGSVSTSPGRGTSPQGRFSPGRHGRSIRKRRRTFSRPSAAAILCNDAELVRKDGAYKIVGDPTEGALISAAAKAGPEQAGPRRPGSPWSRRSPSTPSGKDDHHPPGSESGRVDRLRQGRSRHPARTLRPDPRTARDRGLDRADAPRIAEVNGEAVRPGPARPGRGVLGRSTGSRTSFDVRDDREAT